MAAEKCEHGVTIGEQGGVTQGDIDACKGNEHDEMHLLAFYSACDCCDLLMHHSTVGHGYQVLADGRTLCWTCYRGERL